MGLKNVLSAMSVCIKKAEQLAQSSYGITICNSKGRVVTEFSKGEESDFIY